MSADHELIGKVGHVHRRDRAGRDGRGDGPVRGGTESVLRLRVDADEAIPEGRAVLVLDHEPPRTVIVSRYS